MYIHFLLRVNYRLHGIVQVGLGPPKYSAQKDPPLPTAQILSPRQRSPVGFGGERSSQTPSPQIVATRPTLHTRARPPLLLCNFLLTVVWPILKPLSSEPPLSRRAAMLLAAVVLSG